MTVTRIAADIGGTFTDIAALTDDGRLITRKVPSTPHTTETPLSGDQNLLGSLDESASGLHEIVHGCTVATNAILEHQGARTALLTTKASVTCWSCAAYACRVCMIRSTKNLHRLYRGTCALRSVNGLMLMAPCFSPWQWKMCWRQWPA